MLCYKSYTKGENKDSYPLNFKCPWFNTVLPCTMVHQYSFVKKTKINILASEKTSRSALKFREISKLV